MARLRDQFRAHISAKTRGILASGPKRAALLVASGVVLGILLWNLRPPAAPEAVALHRSEVEARLNGELRSLQALVQGELARLRLEAEAIEREPLRIDAQDRILLLASAPVEADGRPLGAISGFFRRSKRDFPEGVERELLGKAYLYWKPSALAPGAPLAAFPIRVDPTRPEEEVWLTFRAGQKQLFALVDLSTALRIPERPEGIRAYLVSDQGTILSHSLARLNGSSIAASEVFTKASSEIGLFSAAGWDGRAVHAVYQRLGEGIPIRLAVERVAVSLGSNGFFSRLWDGWLLGLSLALGLVALSGLGGWALRRIGGAARQAQARPARMPPPPLPPEKNHARGMEALAQPPSELSSGVGSGALVFARPLDPNSEAARESLSDAVAGPAGVLVGGKIVAARPVHDPKATPEANEQNLRNLRAELQTYQRALDHSRQESELLAAFEAEAARLRDPKLVSVRMVSVAARLCASPALFFGYQDAMRGCRLLAESGLGPGRMEATAGFAVHESILKFILDEVAAGRSPSLADYPPLAKLLLERLGVAHFEAWPLLGNGPLGRLSGKPRLLGVLVILQSGVDSYARKESIQRMLRSTGLIYENTLLAR